MTLPYFPLDAGDYAISMGLQALKEQNWLDIGDNYDTEMEIKRSLLADHRDTVFATTPPAKDAETKILQLVRGNLQKNHPEIDLSRLSADENALVKAASMVQEDLVLMQRSGDDFILGAAVVCFPSGWNLVDKVGKNMREIHIPVPGLNQKIGTSIDRFFQHLKPGKNVQRFNWGLFDDEALFQPKWHRAAQPAKTDISADTIAEQLFFRVEKQTLQRLPGTDDTLFTIRIFNTPLAEVIADGDRARKLHHALTSMPDALRHYKAVAKYEELLFEILKQAAR